MFQFYLSSIKRAQKETGKAVVYMFQFYLSSIKRIRLDAIRKDGSRFNSTLVQLKAGCLGKDVEVLMLFQFYLSSIKSFRLQTVIDPSPSFQFYLSSIKSPLLNQNHHE